MGSSRWSGRLGLLIGGLLLGGAAAEFGVRMLRPDDAADILYSAPDNAPDGLYITDTELFSVPNPGFSGPQRSLGYQVQLRINPNGLRGGPVSEVRPMWLVAGDSFTMAAQVSEEETFSDLLSQRSGGQFLNAGVDGYGTWQALRRYERLDEALDVDGLVLVFFAGNALAVNARWPMVKADAAQLTPGEPIWRPEQSALHRWLYPRSVLYARLQMLMRSQDLTRSESPERGRWASELKPFTRSGEPVLKGLLDKTAPALQAIQASVRARGDRLLVAVAPPAFQIESSRRSATFSLVGLDPSDAAADQVSDGVMALLGQLNIPSCSLVEPLRSAHESGTRAYLAYDGHWSPAGHQVVAEAISECIASH